MEARYDFDSPIFKGSQPVKVLEREHDFLLGEMLSNLNLLHYKPAIIYDRVINQLIGPFADTNKHLTIQETFQSFLWIWNYALVTIYDEAIAKPRLKMPFDTTKVDRAFELLDYGYSLFTAFNPWNLNLPNTQNYTEEDAEYVTKANAAYLFSLNKIILHEIGHIELGHIDKVIDQIAGKYVITATERKQFEYDADSFAIKNLVIGNNNPQFKRTIEYGLIAGFSAIIIIQNKLRAGQYPDADERLKIGIESLNLDEKDNYWGVACLAIKLWSAKNLKDLNWPDQCETYKELFYETLKTIETFK
jgi:hypothetical protein